MHFDPFTDRHALEILLRVYYFVGVDVVKIIHLDISALELPRRKLHRLGLIFYV